MKEEHLDVPGPVGEILAEYQSQYEEPHPDDEGDSQLDFEDRYYKEEEHFNPLLDGDHQELEKFSNED
jgi:hypothetical protein